MPRCAERRPGALNTPYNRIGEIAMRYISLFSGIEAASAAWAPLGWECVALSEIDPFCNAVLRERVPGVPNAGDIRNVDWGKYAGSADVVIGGSPCQSFSVAGKRTGLKGESGLMLEYIRAVQEIRPRCFVWENVPGALSSERGEAFRCLLRAMDEVGYGLAWRVLDAQFFNLAQRRERVFLVGVLGDPARAAEILFEPEGLRWDTPPSKRKRQELTAASGRGPASRCGRRMTTCERRGERPAAEAASAAGFSFKASAGAGSVGFGHEVAPSLLAARNDAACVYAARGGPLAARRAEGEAGASRRLSAPCFGIVGNIVGRRPKNGGNGVGWCEPNSEGMYTLTATDRHAVAFVQNARDEVRLVGGDGGIAGALVASAGAKQQNYLLDCRAVCQCGDAAGALTAKVDSSPCADRGPSVIAYMQSAGEEGRPAGDDGKPAGALAAGGLLRQALLCVADDNANAAVDEDLAGTLKNGGSPPWVANGYVVRRLTPLECERLQGFPDGWTAVEHRGKPASDAQRYRALGNSMAVPVIRWIGERIERVLTETGEVA